MALCCFLSGLLRRRRVSPRYRESSWYDDGFTYSTTARRGTRHLDPIWKDGWITRTDAYLRLAGLMGIKSEDCHFSHMNSRELKKAMSVTFDLIEEVSREIDINE